MTQPHVMKLSDGPGSLFPYALLGMFDASMIRAQRLSDASQSSFFLEESRLLCTYGNCVFQSNSRSAHEFDSGMA